MPHVLIDYLVNAVWQIPLVAIGAAVLTRAGGLSPRVRHQVWLAALALALALPAAPGLGVVRTLVKAPVAVPEFAPTPMTQTATLASNAGLLPPIEVDAGVAGLIVIAFAVVTALGLARLLISWRAAGALVRRSRPVVLASGADEALRGLARAHRRKAPPVRQSDEIRSPVVAGAFWPVILTPRGFVRLGEEEQRAALLHEVAHVVRRDFAINLICEAVSAPIAWHPVTYEIRAGVRQSREMACDAMASAAMASPNSYAHCLLNLAKSLHGNAPSQGSAVLVGLFGRGDLEERLMHLINGPSKRGAGRLLMAGVAACAIVAPAVLLRVTPAFAQAPTVAMAPTAASAPVRPDQSIAPIAPIEPIAPVSPVRHHHAHDVGGLTAPPAPAGRELAEAAPAEPPVPPMPPEPPTIDEQRIQAIVHHAVEQALAARQVMASAEVQAALAQARAHQLTLAEREEIRQAARQSAEAWKAAHLSETMAEVRRELDSAGMREAMREAARLRAPPPPPPPPPPPAPPAPPAP